MGVAGSIQDEGSVSRMYTMSDKEGMYELKGVLAKWGNFDLRESIDFTIVDIVFVDNIIKIRGGGNELYEIKLEGYPTIKKHKEDEFILVVIGETLCLKATSENESELWSKSIRLQIAQRQARYLSIENLSTSFFSLFKEQEIPTDDEDICVEPDFSSLVDVANVISPPKMSVVILVVGTRGDVQPFVYLGQALQRDGHRVRLATHAEYRDDVVAKGGLEFFPLGGDPKKLSEYMVKTAGRLIPDLLNKEEREALPEKMQMLKDICFSCYPACTAADPGDVESERPFTADAIISNPVSYGHIHCAEALSVPIHIMFPQPWSPTREFPHPLANMSFSGSKWSNKNKLAYYMMDEFMWLGLGSMMNRFRSEILQLEPIRVGERGDQLINDNKVPISHMWSPSFVPKCKDWPTHVDVVGEFRLIGTQASPYNPPSALVAFLEAGEKPLYIGFGSMVIPDASKLVSLIKLAAQTIGCRILLQSGWTKYGEENSLLADNVMVIGALPHDWLMPRVAAVVHHGGAGTTAAGLRAGNPTFICPFFGDQHFWAEMVFRAGAGPSGCRVQDLTAEILIANFQTLRNSSVIAEAAALGAKMNAEDGVARGVESFYKHLPLADMICEVSIFSGKQSRLAKIYCTSCGLKLCAETDAILHRATSGRGEHIRTPFRPCRWGVSQGVVSGVTNLFARPIKGGKIVVGGISSHSTSIDDEFISPADTDALFEEEARVEKAYEAAHRLLRWWRRVDTDGNRCLDQRELERLLTSKDSAEARKLFEVLDTDADGIITFTEMAWVLVDTPLFDKITSTV